MDYQTVDFGKIPLRINIIDSAECSCQAAVLADASEIGITILTPLPLPLNSRIAINVSDCFAAIGEVSDWEWDVMGDMARTHLRIIEKNHHWPL